MSTGWSIFGNDWRRIARWSLLAAFVMVLWLLVPVARCSYDAFRDIPLSDDTHPVEITDADKNRVDSGKSFFGDWMHAIKFCYARTPLLEQEPWKSDLMISFAALALLGFGLDAWGRRK
jgi:hypothetical protein